MLFLLFIAFLFNATVVEGVEKGEWRSYYRRKAFVTVLEINRERLLAHGDYSSSVRKALELARKGQAIKGMKILDQLRIEERAVADEAIFAGGLIYEYLGFYPEALGMYERLANKETSPFHTKASLRKAFLELRKGLEREDRRTMRRLSRLFYSIYRKAELPENWIEAILGYGVTLYELGYYRYAEDAYGKIESFLEGRPDYCLFRAENYLKMGRVEEARDYLKKAAREIKTPFLLSYIMMRFGDTYVERKEYKEAEGIYGKTFEARKPPDEGWVMNAMALAELYQRMGKEKEALSLLEGLAERDIDPFIREIAFYRLVRTLWRRGVYDRALELSKRFKDFFPDSDKGGEITRILNGSLRKVLSRAYREGRYVDIIFLYYRDGRVLKEDQTLFLVGKAFLEMGLPNEAITVFERIEKKTPSYLLAMARAYILTGKEQDALKVLERLDGRRERGEEWTETYILLGDMYRRKKELDKAIRAYEKARKRSKDGGLLIKLAALYRLTGKERMALKLYRDVLDTSSRMKDRQEALTGMGDIYYSMRRWEEALTSYKRALPELKGEDRLWALLRMGEIELRFGRMEEARARFKEVAKEDKTYLGRLGEEGLKEVDVWEGIK